MTFTLSWSLGGLDGTVDDVDASWSESISLTRQDGNWRSVSVNAILPIDMTTQRAHPRTGFAILSRDGVDLIAGPWRSTTWTPTSDGRAIVSFDISDDDAEDLGTWPPTTTQFPKRDPGEIVGYDITIGPRRRLGGGAGFAAGEWIETPVLSEELFPNIAEPAKGATWPYPIGQPGRGNTTPAVPAWFYDVIGGKIGISGVPIDCQTVTMYGPKITASADVTSGVVVSVTGVTVNHESRSDGTVYAYILTADISATIDIAPEGRFWWSATTDATPSGAGDVMRSILSASSLAVDRLEWSRVAARLNHYKIDGFSDAQTRPIEFARAQILPLLPLSVVPGPFGLRPVLWPWLDDTDARGIDVVDGVGVSSGDRVSYLEPVSVQSMTTRFGYNPETGQCEMHTSANSASTVYGVLSSDAIGADEIEARLFWDRGSAQSTATDALRWMGWSPRVIEFEIVDHARYGPNGTDDLYPGRRIVLTASRLGVSGAAAIVGEREYDATTALVRMYVLDDPLTAV